MEPPHIGHYREYPPPSQGKPPCSSKDEEEYLSFDEENDETDYVLAKIGSISQDDNEEDSIKITVTTTRSGRRATPYLL